MRIKKVVSNLNINLIPLSFKYALIIAPCSVLGHLIANISLHFVNNFFAAVIGGGIAMLGVIILSKTFNLFNFKDLLSLLKRKHKKTEN